MAKDISTLPPEKRIAKVENFLDDELFQEVKEKVRQVCLIYFISIIYSLCFDLLLFF